MIDVIIPAHNEALRIEPTLRSYLDYFSHRDDVRITVVANACADDTVQVVRRIQEKHQDTLRLFDIPEQIGKGGAILAGWNQSDAEWLAFLDADGSTAPREFERMLDALAGNQVGAIASRFIAGGKVIDRQSVLRTTMSRAFIAWTKLLFRMPYTDTQCGAKVIHSTVYSAIKKDVTTTSMAFDVNLLWSAYQKGYVFTEVPTVWIDKPGSPTLDARLAFLRQGWRMVKELLKIKRSHSK